MKLELTRAEEEIMRILWGIRKGFVKDILEGFPNPKPAYNTVSTIVRILETKGFVAHNAFGKAHEYYPLISRDTYREQFAQTLLQNYFGSSFKQLTSFFVNKKKLSASEIEEIMQLLSKELESKPKKS